MSTSIHANTTQPTIEPASHDDIVAAAHVYQTAAEALSDQLRSRNPWMNSSAREEDLKQAIKTLATLRNGDERAVFVARNGNEIVGMAAVKVHLPHAHLAFFFVLPSAQNKGVGRRLLDEVRRYIDLRGASVITLASSRDPKAWQRYMRFGLHPGPPLLPFRATHPIFPIRAPEHDDLAIRPITPDDLDTLAALDRPVCGGDRRDRLAAWLADGSSGVIVHNRATSAPSGYALVTMHEHHGQIGPVVSASADHFPFMLETALHAAGNQAVWASRPWRVDFSARNTAAIPRLLEAGFSAENLVNWFESGPVGYWDRYIFRDEDEL